MTTQKILTFITFLFLNINTYAQPIVNYSEPFEEPEGEKHIFLMKNGTTLLVNISDNGINVSSYNKDHKLVAKQNTDNNVWTERKYSASSYIGLYELGNNISLFMTMLNRGNMLTLHRIDIDPTTAKVIKAEQIGEMPTRRDYGFALNYLILNNFMIRQDPVTNNYAILFYEGFTAEKSDRISVNIYNSSHSIIRHAVLENTTNARFTKYDGMCMYNNTIYLCTNDYNRKNDGMGTPFYVSMLKDGADKFVTQKLTIPLFNIKSEVLLMYNEGMKTLCMLTNTETGKETKGRFGGYPTVTTTYASTITMINPENLTITASKVVITPKANRYAITKVGIENGFRGTLPSMVINADNSITLLPVTERSISNGRYTTTYIDQMGFIYLDSTGTETDAYVMRIPETSGSIYANSESFAKSYTSTPTGNYLIMNDLEENFSLPENKQPHRMTSISDANAILCKIGDGKIVKSYMFGAPEKKLNQFSFPNSALFDKATNTYITLMIKNSRGDKKMYLAWVKF